MAKNLAKRETKEPKLSAAYDSDADVLYVVLGEPVAAEGTLVDGVIYRYASGHKDRPCGATVIGYREDHWESKLSDLAQLIGRHLRVHPEDITRVIRTGVREAA
jgi:hypothetical protein